MTTQEELDAVKAQLSKIGEFGQSYQADGLQMTRPDYDAVARRVKELERKLAQETRAGFVGGGLGYAVPGS